MPTIKYVVEVGNTLIVSLSLKLLAMICLWSCQFMSLSYKVYPWLEFLSKKKLSASMLLPLLWPWNLIMLSKTGIRKSAKHNGGHHHAKLERFCLHIHKHQYIYIGEGGKDIFIITLKCVPKVTKSMTYMDQPTYGLNLIWSKLNEISTWNFTSLVSSGAQSSPKIIPECKAHWRWSSCFFWKILFKHLWETVIAAKASLTNMHHTVLHDCSCELKSQRSKVGFFVFFPRSTAAKLSLGNTRYT